MPQRRNAIKELRKNKKRQMHHLDLKTTIRKTVKAFVAAVETKTGDPKELLKTVYKKMDKAAKVNILNKKTAARRKARYAKLLNAKASQ